MSELQQKGLEFAKKIFDDIRAMSADVQGVTRQAFSAKETEVLDYLTKIGQSLQLEITPDRAGNVWMTLPGKDRSLPAFVAGSHVDSVPQGGNYDGLAGVTAALTVAWWMRQTGFQPVRDYTVLMMRGEESSFFGKAYMGSLGMLGKLTAKDLALKIRDGSCTLAEAMQSCGIDTEAVSGGKPLVDIDRIAAFVELHIEQGPTLDAQKEARAGIVTGIRGNIRHKAVRILGEAAHSGATDKPYRHDALMAFTDWMQRVDRAWDRWLIQGEDLVFTVGVLKMASSAAISVIPGEVTFSVDIRSLSADTVKRFHDLMQKYGEEVASERGVKIEYDPALVTAPSGVDAALSDRLETSAKAEGIPCMRLASGAGHDSAVLGNNGIPVAMIFVANQLGSHNPHEAMKMEDFMQGTDILWAAVSHFDEK
ncbi:Zn-dependent hydrolase [Parasutterella secunda]|uniref:Zn-dependent hydrolase n=1 Tax=Parasutterella secunda TaxID=626947 RepID=UPI001F948AE8|nr:Zn-dependent hydrolase [Parasutterella secunda]HIR22009.1 Zn-dependent hydrolase [Candidatus Aphodousia faecalis]MCL1595818.1 Zn-dependent hydrolase [Parasutterella secunda]MDM8112556.1 Zn-dependent hydrolase [Parasutterella secunda]MDM8218284.1 Zn-dependent hydrolase [Parasutterella secunda]MDM8226643.1 Zn-dependent hydrolase [Parasutterella secunda]